MKARLEFDLPEDETRFTIAAHAAQIHAGALSAYERLRMLLKHGPEMSDEAKEHIRVIMKDLHEDTQLIELE